MYSILNTLSHDKNLFSKYCCFGDLCLTANEDKSRNRTLGLMVGKRMLNLEYYREGIVFEGLKSIKGILDLTNKYEINTPIIDNIYNSLYKEENIMEMHNNITKYYMNVG